MRARVPNHHPRTTFHTASPRDFNNTTTLASIGTRRITQLQYLLQLSSPTSENSIKAKFAFWVFSEVRLQDLA
jgi:hypothetical protein